jgi:hypothetical protein
VLGRTPATPDALAGGALSIRVDAGRLSLADATGHRWRLPAAAPSLVTGALAFASRDSAAEWLVDIEADGSVHLAPELKDTAAGLAALRADLVPGAITPSLRTTKTVLVDRAVRLRLDGAELRLEADVELRAYEPSTWEGSEVGAVRRRTVPFASHVGPDGTPSLRGPAGEGNEAMATHLGELSSLAGWIGFFRWARAAGVEGLDDLPAALPREPDAPRTPTHVSDKERADWILRGHARSPGEVPDWMRRFRANEGSDR